ncbi:hypothetical protein N8T08_009297 [Aspergillus melleus]|uniref:Uncharacterized protein n=1 Tax=Aspergillus melleus TaxID=138277 RepID=A0ACC3ATT7_9EURO|nr:hypothetical protein N8T08_009297 [Aspergillus melleus]
MEIPAEKVPQGWTNDPKELEALFYRGSGERVMARRHGLSDPQIILTNTPDTGEMGFILKDGDEYFWGDLMIDHISKITTPTELSEILEVIAAGGIKALRRKRVKPVRDIWGPEDDEEWAEREEAEAREEQMRGRERPPRKPLDAASAIMAEQLLPFLGRINLRDAYEFDQAAILVCLQHIVSNPGLYRVPAANVPNLVLIHQDIVRLR